MILDCWQSTVYRKSLQWFSSRLSPRNTGQCLETFFGFHTKGIGLLTDLVGGGQFSSVQSLSHAWLFATLWIAARQASLSLESVMPSNDLILCHPLLLLPSRPFKAAGSFPMSQLFTSGGQNIGVSASTSVLPMNTQDWSPLGWTGWISLQSKGLSKESSPTPQFKNINSSALSFLYSGQKCY